MTTSIERFTKTVESYLKYRPSYPKEIVSVLEEECGLTPEKVIADIGSGTGFLSKLFLTEDYMVFGVEPNDAMRKAGETYLKTYLNFRSINGTAEDTTLADNSIDIIVAGTAFHWFNPEKTKQEFRRILKSSGYVLLVWNVRNSEFPLMQDYEKLIIKYGTDYCKSGACKFNHSAGEDFFSPHKMQTKSFVNIQRFDWEGFKGRLLSASSALHPGDKNYEAMLSELKKIFDQYQKNGLIDFVYDTKLYYGQLK